MSYLLSRLLFAFPFLIFLLALRLYSGDSIYRQIQLDYNAIQIGCGLWSIDLRLLATVPGETCVFIPNSDRVIAGDPNGIKMIEVGDIWSLKGILGHVDVQTTQRYAHLSQRHQKMPAFSFHVGK